MRREGLHEWNGETLHAHDDEAGDGADPRLLVADSWLVDEGQVLALDVHRDRFVGSVALLPGAPTGAELDAFWAAVVAAVPSTGAWFPRVEAVAAGRVRPGTGTPTGPGSGSGSGLGLRVRVRPAPPRRREVVLATADHDPRTTPLVKGPDLEALGEANSAVHDRGADEAVLLSPEGHVVEGAWSSLVWWRGDALCMPSDDLPRLPGVTVRSLVTLAAVMGVDVLHERTTPAELEGFEVWSLGSLHGIRIATAWVDGPSLAEQPGRLDLWRRRLDRLRRPARP